ncbi:DUF5008 domain-containing protein [Pedobacter sp. MC2016-05]|uniref:DUF5008 domain-containing protein n=1 Tax=Pedobacter sp. MC2016-05 TaxID=2994474 RepID=UPI00224845EF|nr:DUF5008 domain-containing protein [Pedobacter sp. MC2016-05]MCX2473761.1 DUF5008 domain-containing protein [Pedobacter sp. MC2016-05]
MMFNKIKIICQTTFLGLLLGATIVGCEKAALQDDPYGGGKKPVEFTFVAKNIDKESVNAGDVISVKVAGLAKFREDYKVYVNEAEAEVIKNSTNDTTLVFKVPLNASTGSVWVTSMGQTFFGPIVNVGGKISFDNTWKVVNGSDYLPIYDIEALPSGRYFLSGAFFNFEGKATEKVPIGGIAQVDADGGYLTTDVNFGKGVGGGFKSVYSVARINTGSQAGKFILAGSFTSFNSTRPNRQTLSNMVRLNTVASPGLATMDSLVLTDIVNPKPEEIYKNGDTVSAFNGGTDGYIRKAMVLDEKIYVVGNFQNYRKIFFRGSSYDEKIYDVTRMRQLVRMDVNGSMDSTYRFNPSTKQSPAAGNGEIKDAVLLNDGSLILVGSFTTFDGKPANRIVKLKPDGTIDDSFKVGSGTDGDIYSIRWNESTQKYVVAGLFTTFNGKAAVGINLLNADGSNVSTFIPEAIAGGIATFAGQLMNGKIIVAGSFNNYGGFLRQGFMVIENTGKLAVGYNNTGGFQGQIYDMIENRSANGSKVILVGSILRFNSRLPKNIMRLNFAN